MISRYKYVFNYAFILSLLLLLLNDHFLKDIYGNWVTGKLSDFAGILLLPLFLKCTLRISDKGALLSTFVFFLLWKSHLIQPFLDAFNSFSSYKIGRVVDYTDYIGFLILPFAGYIMRHIDQWSISIQHGEKLAMVIVMPICVFAFVATSDDENFDPGVLDSDFLNCCSREPLEAEVGTGKIFIPSAFTPDGNGINDFFYISADSNILRIDTFTVYEILNYDTVFQQINMNEFLPTNGYDGVHRDTIVPATYYYRVNVTSKDSVQRFFEGVVCSFPCLEPTGLPQPSNLSVCGFSAQHDFLNGYNSRNDSGEDFNCFE